MATAINEALAEQSVGNLLASGNRANDHNQTYNKILDLIYATDSRIPSLVQSLGAREVTSEAGQRGIPTAAIGTK